jgi:hypothetical protein
LLFKNPQKMKTSKSIIPAALVAAIATSLALTACGGGGSDNTTSGSISTPTGSGGGATTSPTPVSPAPVVQVPPVVTAPAPTATATVTVNSANGPRTLTVPLATPIGSAQDTLPSSITGEPSLALWPMVAGIKAYEDVAGKLTAGQFPPGIWPIAFKHTYKITTDRNDPTSGATSSDFACSLDLVAGALVATVDGRTFSVPIDDAPTYTADSFGNPVKGDGYRLLVTPTLTAAYGPATQRYLTLQAETYNAYVDPTYGPRNAGPTMTLYSMYSGFIAGSPAGSTTHYINSTDTRIGVFTSYRCKDQLL